MRARPYQTTAVDAALAEFDRGAKSTLIVMPTGTGKTVVFALVGDSRDWGRVLVLAGRQELIEQAQDKIRQVTGEVPDIDMAQSFAPMLSQDLFASGKYVCGSIQTVSKARRLGRYNWRDFGLIVVDEAHHALASTYRRVVDAARAENPNIRVLLVTATPDRGDGKALGQVCETVAYRYDINDAIEDGYLVPIYQQFAVINGLDFSHVRTKGGDFDAEELSAVLADDGGEMPHKIALGMVQAARQEKAVIFTVNVKSAHKVAEIINDRILKRPGIAVAMDGDWDKDRRRAALAAYERGEFQYLCNCNLFTEGWDSPTVSVVGMARPTKSRALYAQAVGRGLRPLPGLVDGPDATAESRRAAIACSAKHRALVVDLVGNAGRHKLVCSADLLGGDYEPAVVQAAASRARGRKTPADMKQLLDSEKEKLGRKREDAERRRARDNARVYANANVEFVPVDPFRPDVMPGGAGADAIRPERLCSAGQLEYLRGIGIDARGMSFVDAQKLCAKSFARRNAGLCSIGTLRNLSAHGYNGEKLSERAGAALLDLVRANGSAPNEPVERSNMRVRRTGQEYRVIANIGGREVSVGKSYPTLDKAIEYGNTVLTSQQKALNTNGGK
jgi:superfamily II DNA or RNA helicase